MYILRPSVVLTMDVIFEWPLRGFLEKSLLKVECPEYEPCPTFETKRYTWNECEEMVNIYRVRFVEIAPSGVEEDTTPCERGHNIYVMLHLIHDTI